MKLVMAIINDEDAPQIIDDLGEKGYSITKLATTGGFLRAGNTTLICGCTEDRIPDLVGTIEKRCHARTRVAPLHTGHVSGTDGYMSYPMEVTVGGATIFVLGVEDFKKI